MTLTPSLRRRVTLSALALLATVLVILGVVIDVAFGSQVRRDLHDRLVATTARADALAAANTSPEQVTAELNDGGIRALLVTSGGQAYGDPAISPDIRPGPGTGMASQRRRHRRRPGGEPARRPPRWARWSGWFRWSTSGAAAAG